MKTRVIVFPCGSVPATDINWALRYSMRIEVFGASSIDDHGKFIYENYIGGVPNINDINFISEFNRILVTNNIEFIIPTHDTVALYLIEHQEEIRATVVTSEYETNKICRYKDLTYKTFSNYDFVPLTYSKKDIDDMDFPVFLKPKNGQGSNGTCIANNELELEFHLQNNSDLLVCELLPGVEITVDCFTDKDKKLRFIGPRTRSRQLAGISVNSKRIDITSEISNIVNAINDKLALRGYWFVQLKKDTKGKYKLLEISTRIAGTYCLNRNLDINFPLLSVLDFAGEDVEILPNNYEIEVDRSLIDRYMLNIKYERVYINFDETIVFKRKKYNQYLMMFIYQCLNQNKEIILITQNDNDIRHVLKELKIDFAIFDDIIQLKSTDSKYLFMNNNKDSIFIDHSFSERKLVKNYLGIPSFDVSNIECLIDWRG